MSHELLLLDCAWDQKCSEEEVVRQAAATGRRRGEMEELASHRDSDILATAEVAVVGIEGCRAVPVALPERETLKADGLQEAREAR